MESLHSDTSRGTQTFPTTSTYHGYNALPMDGIYTTCNLFRKAREYNGPSNGRPLRHSTGIATHILGYKCIACASLYDKVLVPAMERGSGGRRKGGFTPLQRMGFGLAVSICAMVAAALVEQRRMKMVVKAGLLDNPTAIVPMSIFWLVPQYFLVGLAEIFTYVGQLHFFYAEVSEGMRSLSTSLFIAELGLGSWISSLLVTIVQKTTGGDDDGWILNNINQSKIDRFYWLLAALSVVNFGLFLLAASHHRYKQHHCVSIST